MQLHNALLTEAGSVIKHKQILIFKEMLRAIRYDDLAVAVLLCAGVNLVSMLKPIGVWRPEIKCPPAERRPLGLCSGRQKDVMKDRSQGETIRRYLVVNI